MKDEVFLVLLKQQPFYKVGLEDSSIMWGNVESKLLITIITNPHCNPCAEIHKQIKKLMNEVADKVYIQYIFSSFNKELESSGSFLTALYMKNKDNKKYVDECFDEWFESGKSDRENFFIKYGVGLDLHQAKYEYDKHIHWCKSFKIEYTPIVLINGYRLSKDYALEDLKNFVHLEIATPDNL